MGRIKKEGDIIVASGSKSKLWRDMNLKRALQDWNMEYVDSPRSPGSAVSVFTSSERLTGQLKINEIREVGELVTETETNAPNIGKLVRKIEMGDPLARKLIKKVETGDRKVGELVKKVQIWKLVRRDQEIQEARAGCDVGRSW